MGNFYLNRGIERLHKLGINGELKKWYINRVWNETDIKNRTFYKPYSKDSTCEINPQNLIGTTHQKYNDNTIWIEMLGALKRDIYLDAASLTEVIMDYKLRGKSVAKYGDKYLITGGNNRLCLAKFLGLKKVKVDLSEYTFDDERFNIHNKLEELKFAVKTFNNEDGIEWEINSEKIFFRINGSALAEKFIEYFQSVSIQTRDYIKYRWHYKNKSISKELKYINSEKDFVPIRPLIIAHKHNLPLKSQQ